MTEIVYDYPKSSCACCVSSSSSDFADKGNPTSMSVKNCKTPEFLECHNNPVFKHGNEPTYEDGVLILNPELYNQHKAKGFTERECSNRNFCNVSYYTPDPRLYDSARSQTLTLNKPPITGELKISEINTDPLLDGYGQHYKNYSDINAGQVTYYIDKSIQDVEFPPVFTTQATVVGKLYKDPMGSIKPAYTRIPTFCENPVKDRGPFEGSLSWMQDSNFHRQDLLSKQMWKINQQKYSSRWNTDFN